MFRSRITVLTLGVALGVSQIALGLDHWARADEPGDGRDQSATALKRSIGPVLSQYRIVSVAPYYEQQTRLKSTWTELRGATMRVQAERDLTAPWLQLRLEQALGSPTEVTANSPLAVAGVRIGVSSAADGVVVTLATPNKDTGQEVLARAHALWARSDQAKGPTEMQSSDVPVLFEHHIVSVAPYYAQQTRLKSTWTELRGATIRVLAERGLTAEWLQLRLEHALGAPAETTANSPLAVSGVHTSVSSAADGFVVTFATPDKRAGEEVLARAEALQVARRDVGYGATEMQQSAAPALGTHRIVAVGPYYEQQTRLKTTWRELRGATVQVRPEPGLTAEWLQLQLEKSLTSSLEATTDNPLAVPGVNTSVSSAGDSFVVTIAAPDKRTAEAVLARADGLLARQR